MKNITIKQAKEELVNKYLFDDKSGIKYLGIVGIGIHEDDIGEYINIKLDKHEPDVEIPNEYEGFRVNTEYTGKIRAL